MATAKAQEQMAGYTEAVKSGLYAKKSGLVGKYDNVRRYWEDELTRVHLRPYLEKLIAHCRKQVRRLRIIDLGCGSADGYELLSGVRDRDASLRDDETDLLTPDIMGVYKGTDLNEDLLEQARRIYGSNPKMVFEQADFTEGLPLGNDEKPFDLYFSSYGTCSHHNDDKTMVNLLSEIAERTQTYSVVVCDWLGRYSYEWQTLWTDNPGGYKNMDYVVSYIYSPEEREARREELQHLTLRLMSQHEALDIIKRASKKSGVQLKPAAFFDRSVLTGRHMDTQEYNTHAQPLREAVNSLHEVNQRTNPSDLLFDYVPREGFQFLNDYFEQLQMCWNTLVQFTQNLLDQYDEDKRAFTKTPEVPASYPDFLQESMERMRHVVDGVGWMRVGLPRENIIEPQLGYALRRLVTKLQQGQGAAHGLLGIIEIDKRQHT